MASRARSSSPNTARATGARRAYIPAFAKASRARAFGFPLACVTNKLQTFSDALLAAVGLADAFEFVQGGDALPRGKPDPLPLTHAATRLGFAPPEVLMIGDSANDALAARRAGMPVVLVDYGYTEDQHVDAIDCDAVVSSIDDAIAALDPHRGSFDPASRADHLITSTKTGS